MLSAMCGIWAHTLHGLAVFADALIIGASSVNQLQQNLKAMVAGPLAPAVVQAMNGAWDDARGVCPKYFRIIFPPQAPAAAPTAAATNNASAATPTK